MAARGGARWRRADALARLSESVRDFQGEQIVLEGDQIQVELAELHLAVHTFLLEHSLTDEGFAWHQAHEILELLTLRLVKSNVLSNHLHVGYLFAN